MLLWNKIHTCYCWNWYVLNVEVPTRLTLGQNCPPFILWGWHASLHTACANYICHRLGQLRQIAPYCAITTILPAYCAWQEVTCLPMPMPKLGQLHNMVKLHHSFITTVVSKKNKTPLWNYAWHDKTAPASRVKLINLYIGIYK